MTVGVWVLLALIAWFVIAFPVGVIVGRHLARRGDAGVPAHRRTGT